MSQEPKTQDRNVTPDRPPPGTRLANPAEPYATTEVKERPDASSFVKAADSAERKPPTDYPKIRYHPVHGGITVKDAAEEGALQPKTDWFDSPELADAARTYTEAEIVRTNNQMAKLKALEEAGHPIVRDSVQADESIRRGYPEPL
jgi:hypothetical protein